jgi:hypothetical protein
VSDIDIELLRADVGAALAEVLSRHERSMLTRWVVVAETVEAEDGTRGLWCLAPDDAKKWDTLGLLHHALDVERANTIADRIAEGDD